MAGEMFRLSLKDWQGTKQWSVIVVLRRKYPLSGRGSFMQQLVLRCYEDDTFDSWVADVPDGNYDDPHRRRIA